MRSRRGASEPPATAGGVDGITPAGLGATARASGQRTPSSTTSASAAPGIDRADERRFALAVLDSIFGGSTSSRLFREVREKRGLAYSVGSYSEQYTDTGLVAIYVGTREDNVEEACA